MFREVLIPPPAVDCRARPDTCPSISLSRTPTASALSGRSSIRFCIRSVTNASSAGGACGSCAKTRGGGVLRCIWSVSAGVFPRNGGRPVSNSNSTTPSEYRSVCGHGSGLPRICSGAMYRNVPSVRPSAVSFDPSRTAANPKSASFSVPSAASRKFPGFRSRWTTPFPCANASAAQICVANVTTASGVRRPLRSSRSCRVPPDRYSIA